jgi:hypothetical protein
MRSAQVIAPLVGDTEKVVASVLREEDKMGTADSNVAREFASTQAAQ